MRSIREVAVVLFIGVCAACAAEPEPFDIEAGEEEFFRGCEGRSRGGPIVISTQDELDALSGVTEVNGDLTITAPLVLDLAPLSALRCVRGDLAIEQNPDLTSLRGLESLVVVNALRVNTNPMLTDVDGLVGLRFVGPFATTAAHRVSVSGNQSLTSVAGLSGLTEVHGTLSVSANDSLPDLSGLEHVRAVWGDLTIRDDESLVNVDGLSSLERVNGLFQIELNPRLETVRLPALLSVDDDPERTPPVFRGLELAQLDALTDLELTRLEITVGLSVTACPSLARMNLRALTTVVHRNAITGSLIIEGAEIESIDLSRLTRVDGDVDVDARALVRLDAPELASVGGSVQIGEAFRFNPVSDPPVGAVALPSLTEVEGDFVIQNTALEALTGLDALGAVGGNLTIEGNPFLMTLAGMGAVTEVGRGVDIASNRVLPTCEAEAFVARLEAAGFDGPSRVGANDDTAVCP